MNNTLIGPVCLPIVATIHNHDERYYQKFEIDTMLSVLPDGGLTYTREEIDTKLDLKLDKNTYINGGEF